MTITVVMLP